jgi:hypothetical protein
VATAEEDRLNIATLTSFAAAITKDFCEREKDKRLIFFLFCCDRCSIAKTSAAHDRLVQKIALTAIVDQAHNSK